MILLVGSDGVPRYFRGFITAETRDDWIVLLAVASVAFYVLSVLLTKVEERFAEVGSEKVLRSATQLALVRGQDDVAKEYFIRICRASSSLLLAVLLLGVVCYFYVGLFAFLAGLILLEFCICGATLAWASESRFGRYIQNKSNNLMTVFASVNFLLVFAYLLVEFLAFGGVNILIAILAVLIARLLFTNLSQLVNGSVRLTRARAKVNSLVFNDHQLHWRDPVRRQKFRSLFDNASRRERLAEVMGVEADKIRSRFTDRGPADVAVFDVEISQPDGGTKHFLEMVYAASKIHIVENEDVFFENVSAGDVGAAPLLYQYEVNGYVGRLYDGGTGESFPRSKWNKQRRNLLLKAWQCPPPAHLVEIFTAGKPLLQDRLNPKFRSALEVAMDCSEELAAYESLLQQLDELQEVIAGLPLFIFNPRIVPGMLVVGGDTPRSLNWGQWTLAPLGCGLDFAKDLSWLHDSFDTLVAEGIVPDFVSCRSIELSALAWELERLIQSQQLKSGVELLPEFRIRLAAGA